MQGSTGQQNYFKGFARVKRLRNGNLRKHLPYPRPSHVSPLFLPLSSFKFIALLLSHVNLLQQHHTPFFFSFITPFISFITIACPHICRKKTFSVIKGVFAFKSRVSFLPLIRLHVRFLLTLPSLDCPCHNQRTKSWAFSSV